MTDDSTQCTVAAEERKFRLDEQALRARIEWLEKENFRLSRQLVDTSHVLRDSMTRQDVAHAEEVQALKDEICRLRDRSTREAALCGESSEALDHSLKSSREERQEIQKFLTILNSKLDTLIGSQTGLNIHSVEMCLCGHPRSDHHWQTKACTQGHCGCQRFSL